jgi:UDP:flavonoid glycosyltransferase YjiC (YdhE family)
MLDRLLLRSLNDLRKKYQLPPVDSAAELLHSRHHTAALFPEWFAPRQPDWPTPLSYWGFPRWDEADSYSARPELTEFLQQGSPPIVFTPGTAQAHAQGFWQAAVGALARLGARGIFLTRHPHQLPPSLPGTVRHFPYVPLSRLLPECRAVVHHGGIGTVSQGLAAGIPQVVTPFAYDQPDNGTRLCRLGVARMVFASDLSPSKLARGLTELLDSPSTAAACERWRVALRDTDGLGTAVSLIENWR